VLNLILETVSIAYHKARIVHGDLSECNMMVRGGNEMPFAAVSGFIWVYMV
jgi:serine/threonine-protein kinase RIO1